MKSQKTYNCRNIVTDQAQQAYQACLKKNPPAVFTTWQLNRHWELVYLAKPQALIMKAQVLKDLKEERSIEGPGFYLREKAHYFLLLNGELRPEPCETYMKTAPLNDLRSWAQLTKI